MSARREMVRSASRTLGRLATAGLFAAGTVALSAGAASAHPLGNLSVNRATEVVVARDAVRVLRVVDRAEIPTVQLKAQLADLPRYAPSACAEEASTLRVLVRESVASLAPAGSAATLLPGQAGLRTLRLECRYLARMVVAEGDAIRVVEGSTRIAVGWREIVIRADGLALRSSDAPNTSPTSLLTRYPDDALTSPSDQRSADAVAGPTSAAATADPQTERATAAFRPVNALTAAADRLVSGSATPAALALLAATAFALGAAHALAPGHGKTVMAFYLAGRERRSLRSAVAVVGTVTATHTSTVLLLGLLIGLGTAVAPAAVTLWAGVVSGLLVAAAGAALVVRAWRSRHHDRHGHVHSHGHGNVHLHGHGHGHAHEHEHSHEAEHEHGAGRGVLVSLGAAGGLVPSPSALLLLLGAVAAGRAFLGVGLVVLFGLGMAATLAAVSGIALGLRARLDGVGGHLGRLWRPVSRLMPVSSGAVICLIGLGMATRGLGAAIA